MKLSNAELQNFIKRIKLKPEYMSKYRTQINNLKTKLEDKIKNDENNQLKVLKYIIGGSWKKRTILRPTGENPIDIDLVLFIQADESFSNDIEKLHDFIVGYLEAIYPQKDIKRDVDAEGKTKSIKIKFVGTGLEVDIVPVVPLVTPVEYVWQPERGGGGKYITSVSKQLAFSQERRKENPSFTSIVRAIKWWRNIKELNPSDDEPGLSSFAIELIASYIDITWGVEQNIEEGIIRFFQVLCLPTFPEIIFKDAINNVPKYQTPIFIGDDTNNENNVAKKLDAAKWKEIIDEANDAFESLNIAQSKNFKGDTTSEWDRVFGPSFNITEL